MTWYMIDGFNGYEINEEGIVRSMKMMNANPAHQIKLYARGTPNAYYELSNNFNKRVKVRQKDLIDLVFHSGKPLIPREDAAIYMGSRNKHFYFDKGIYPKNNEEKKVQMDFSHLIVKD